MTAAGARAVEFLRKRLRPVATVEPVQLSRLLTDLDSGKFATRASAFRELQRLGSQAEPALRQARQGKLTPEARRRIEALLASPGLVRSPETLRQLRAIKVLEVIGSREARQVLRALAAGAPAARETEDARASLRRLAQRQ
jgi:hypothetical protein